MTPAACETYFYWARAFTSWAARRGVLPAALASPYLVREFVADRLTSGVAASTVRTATPAVRRYLDFLREFGIQIPGQHKPEIPRASSMVLFAPNRDEFARFLGAASQYRDPYGTAFRLLAYTGMRDSELIALTLDDGDRLPSGVINFVVRGKGNKFRNVPLQPDGEPILMEYLKTRRTFPKADRHRWLFPVPDTTRHVSRKSMEMHMRFLREQADLPELTCHGLRRYFITERKREGMPDSVIAKIVGHEDLALFLRYYAPTAEDLADEVLQTHAQRGVEHAAR